MADDKKDIFRSEVTERLSSFFEEKDPSATGVPEKNTSASQDSPLLNLNAILLSIEWEITDEIRRKYLAAWGQPGALTGGLNYYRASPLYPPASEEDRARIQGIADLPREVFSVQVPCLVIWGEKDTALLPGLLDGLDRYVEDLTIKRIPEASHWVVHEQPAKVNRHIREFIKFSYSET